MTGLPDQGLTLSGDLSHPTIKNSTNRKVIVYALRFEQSLPDGQVVLHTAIRSALLAIRNGSPNEMMSIPVHGQRTFTPRPGEVSDVVSGVSLDGAVFEDGEFVGPDLSGSYEWIVAGISAQRDLHRSVLSNKAANLDSNSIWIPVNALAANEPVNIQGRAQWNYAKKQKLFAQELLKVKELRGEEAAYELAAKSANLPNVWRSK